MLSIGDDIPSYAPYIFGMIGALCSALFATDIAEKKHKQMRESNVDEHPYIKDYLIIYQNGYFQLNVLALAFVMASAFTDQASKTPELMNDIACLNVITTAWAIKNHFMQTVLYQQKTETLKKAGIREKLFNHHPWKTHLDTVIPTVITAWITSQYTIVPSLSLLLIAVGLPLLTRDNQYNCSVRLKFMIS